MSCKVFLVLGWVGCCGLLGAGAKGGTDINPENGYSNRLDKAWKRYHNQEVGYCVNYPSRWAKEMAFEGTGLVVETGVQKYSKPIGEIDIGMLAEPASADARLQPVSLADEMKAHIAGLQKFVRAERLETIDEHQLQVEGHSALFVKNRYYDPLERVNWTEEVVFVKRNGELFRLELQCQTEQLKRFEPVFANVVKTLQFECK